MNDYDQEDLSAQDYRRLFEDYVHGFGHEHDLIDRKVTWLLTSQTILFAALGLTLRNASVTLVRVIGAVGLTLCISISVGLIGNIIAKWCIYNDYKTREQEARNGQKVRWALRGSNRVEFGVRPWLTSFGITTDLAIPLAFAVAWLVVLVLSEDIVDAVVGTSVIV